MPKSVNKVILVGNVGKDPEVKFSPSGTPIAKFSLATNEKYKDRSDEWQERTVRAARKSTGQKLSPATWSCSDHTRTAVATIGPIEMATSMNQAMPARPRSRTKIFLSERANST
jgi:primosomal replication protein N